MKIGQLFCIWVCAGLLMGVSGRAIALESDTQISYQEAADAREGKIRLGHLSIISGLVLQEEYDDNIFLGNGDETDPKVSDWLSHLKPSLFAKYDMMERGALSLGYTGDFAYYATNSSNNWASNKIAFKGDYKAPVGLIVGIANDYVNADDPYSDMNDYKLGQKSQRWNNDLRNRLGYEFFDKFRILAFYNFFKQRYSQDQDYNQNYDSNEVGAGVEMRVMPLTWAFLSYHAGERDYTGHPIGVPNYSDATDADFTSSRVNTGLRWDATAKISGELNLGYQWLTAKNDTDPYGVPYEDNNTWIANTRMTYQAAPKTRVGAELSRATLFSGGNLSEFYEQTGVGISLNQDVIEKGVLRAAANYARDNYNRPAFDNREDDNYRARVGFDYYFLEWLKTGVEYRFWEKNSNYNTNDFTDNRFMMIVGLAY